MSTATSSLPLRLDRENAGTYGRYSAARRVARTVFLGSAPLPAAANRGIDDRRILLGFGPAGGDPGDLRRRPAQAGGPGDLPLRERRPLLVRDAAIGQPARPRPRRAAGRRPCRDGDRAAPQVGAHGPRALRPRPSVAEVRLGRARRGRGRARRAADRSTRTTPRPRRRGRPRRPREILASRGAGARTNQNMLVFLAADYLRLAELDAGGARVPRVELDRRRRGGRTAQPRWLPAEPGQVAARRCRRDRPRSDPRGVPVATRPRAGRSAGEGRAAPGEGVGLGRAGRSGRRQAPQRGAPDHQVRRCQPPAWCSTARSRRSGTPNTPSG